MKTKLKIITIVILLLIIAVLIFFSNREETTEDRVNKALELYFDIAAYGKENNEAYSQDDDRNLIKQLNDFRDGKIDKIEDERLEELVNKLIDYLTEELPANELMEFGLNGLLSQMYDIDDMLNPKNITMIHIEVIN